MFSARKIERRKAAREEKLPRATGARTREGQGRWLLWSYSSLVMVQQFVGIHTRGAGRKLWSNSSLESILGIIEVQLVQCGNEQINIRRVESGAGTCVLWTRMLGRMSSAMIIEDLWMCMTRFYLSADHTSYEWMNGIHCESVA